MFGCSEICSKLEVLKLNIKVNNAISTGILEYSIFLVAMKSAHSGL